MPKVRPHETIFRAAIAAVAPGAALRRAVRRDADRLLLNDGTSYALERFERLLPVPLLMPRCCASRLSQPRKTACTSDHR